MIHKLNLLKQNIESVFFGKEEVVEFAITALLAKGHLLIEDVPGVGKTLLALSLARSINCSFQRIQFTSDLLPSDIIGATVFDQRTAEFKFKPGPIFSNIILADEINRTTPKVQSALLEAMNENKVSVDGVTYPLSNLFMVIATQNPIEYHGTFPLPEAQLDRFLMRIKIGYLQKEDEKRIFEQENILEKASHLEPVMTIDEIIELQQQVGNIKVDDSLSYYLLEIVNRTREHKNIRLGISPRGALQLYRASQAHALFNKRDYCIPDDIKKLILPVFSHRIILKEKFDSTQKDVENVLLEILNNVEVPL